MIEITLPGRAPLRLEHLVLDYNGTLACDGDVLPEVSGLLTALAGLLRVHIVTGDTFGNARAGLAGLACELVVLPREAQAREKQRYIEQLGPDHCVAIGNGRNDHLMLKRSALGIVVVQAEGAAVEALLAADVVVSDVATALSLLLNPLRLTATLRS
jgi:soluble P-type ATPase